MAEIRILIVEDEVLIARDIERKLTRAGYVSLGFASSGEEAVEKALSLQPSLILMDIRLHGLMDGVEAAAQIRLHSNVPIIYLTAYTDEHTLQRARLTEPHGYLVKPFEAHELRSSIEMALYRHRLEAERLDRQHYLEVLNRITQAALETADLKQLLHLLVGFFSDLTQADGCHILLWDENQQSVTSEISADMKSCYSGSDEQHIVVFQHFLQIHTPTIINKPQDAPPLAVLLANCAPHAALLILPLIAAEKRLGLVIAFFGQDHQPDPASLERYQQAARLVSLAVAKTQLLLDSTRRTANLEAMLAVSSALRSVDSRQALIPVILDQVMRLVNVDAAALIQQNGGSGEPNLEGANGVWQEWQECLPTQVTGISKQVISTGEAYRNHQAGNLGQPLLSVVCIPLNAQEQIIGVLWAGRRSPVNSEDFQLLVSISNIAAIAINRQSLHEKIKEQLNALESAQARLVQSEKLAAIGKLIAGVAHELNNPLTSVLLHAQFAQQNTPDTATTQELEAIVKDAARATDIVRGLLDFARQRAPKRSPVNLNDILNSSLSLVAYELRSHNIEVHLSLAPDLPMTMADPYQLQQVFINLITNSWQAMNEKRGQGRLSIYSEVGLSTYLSEQDVSIPVLRVSFQDNGPGITRAQLSRIFDPFYTTKHEAGTGLGLSICHGIITEHGGYIWAESEPGQGATFIIELPLVAVTPPRELTEIVPGERQAAHPGHAILMVDDEVSILSVLSRALKRRGYAVDTATNGQEALQMTAQTAYDLIICDMRMPGMNGHDFYSELQAQNPALLSHLIFTTGDTVSAATRNFLAETQVPYLAKPFELQEFFQIIELALQNNSK